MDCEAFFCRTEKWDLRFGHGKGDLGTAHDKDKCDLGVDHNSGDLVTEKTKTSQDR